MARRLPRPLARRESLYGVGTPREALVQLAEAYLDRDLVFDAVEFFAQARDREGLARVRSRAIEAGDAFLLRRVQEMMPDLVPDSDWQELARAAHSLGKETYAERARKGGVPPPLPLQEEESPGEVPQDEPGAEAAPPSQNGRERKAKRRGG